MLLSIVVACLCPSLRAQDEIRASQRVSTARELVSREKRSPTTGKNARRRYKELVEFVRQSGDHERRMPRQTAMRILGLLDEGQADEAAKLVHVVILDLKSVAASDGDTRTLERLVDEEKRSPTTEHTVERRHRALIRTALGTGVPIRYLPPGKMAPVDELLARGDLAEAAAELHSVILEIDGRLSSGGDAARTPTHGAERLRVPSAPTTAGKAASR